MKKLIFFLFIVLLISFLFYEKRDQPKISNKKLDFIFVTSPPKEAELILRNSCYDCHSLETNYPNYSKYFPMSIFINRHVAEGREHINFSEWQKYNTESKNFIIQNLIKQIEKNKMPMASYKLLHKEAILNQSEKEFIIKWLKSLKY